MTDTEPFATRLPQEEAHQLQTALQETGRTQSEHVARAIRYYHRQNPDNIPALHPKDQKPPNDQSDKPERDLPEERDSLSALLGPEWAWVTDA